MQWYCNCNCVEIVLQLPCIANANTTMDTESTLQYTTLRTYYKLHYNYITITLPLAYNYKTTTKNCNTSAIQLQCNYNTITIQLQYGYNTIRIQLQHNYNSEHKTGSLCGSLWLSVAFRGSGKIRELGPLQHLLISGA